MRTLVNTVFSKLNTVVFYTWPEVFLGNSYTDVSSLVNNIDKWKATNVLYRVTDNNLTDINLSEYGIKFDLPKNKVNNSLVSDSFDANTKELFGIDYSDLYKLENFVIPSNIELENSEKLPYSFFGNSTSNADNTKLYLLEVPKNCSRIEFYTNSIDHNVAFSDGSSGFYRSDYLELAGDSTAFWENGRYVISNSTPDMVIDLGPDTYEYYNKDRYYCPDATYTSLSGTGSGTFASGTVRRSLEDSIEAYEYSSPEEYYSFYRELEDEIFCKKVIWFIIHNDIPTNLEVNLAKRALYDSKNPLRKKDQYCLRNDEFYDISKNFNLVYKKSDEINFYYERSTDSIIGNEVINKLPILSKKKEILASKLEDNTSDYSIYSRFVTYSLGDIVKYNGNYYESISNNNTDIPVFSNSWILKENFDGLFSKCIHFVSDPPGAINFIPKSATIPNNAFKKLKLVAIENHGYSVDDTSLVTAVGNKESKELKLLEDFTYLNAKSETDDDFKKTFTIIDWSKINSMPDCNKIIFNAIQKAIVISINIRLDGKIITLGNVESIDKSFGRHKITSETLFSINRSSKRPISSFPSSGFSLSDKIELDFEWLKFESRNLELDNITSVHHSPSGDYTKDLILDENFTINDTIDSTEIEVYVDLKSKKKDVRLIYNCTEFEVNYPYVEVKYGDSINIQFYTIFNPETENMAQFDSVEVNNFFPIVTKDIVNGKLVTSDDTVLSDISSMNLSNNNFTSPSTGLINYIGTLKTDKNVFFDESIKSNYTLTSETIEGNVTVYTLSVDKVYNDLQIKLNAK